jgi:hypothetical protein
MTDTTPDLPDPAQTRQLALSTWENEGGAPFHVPQAVSMSGGVQADLPTLTNTELVQLRIRVIALENLMIALLAQASDRQLELAREMATYISPRPGFTHHPLTIRAAEHMTRIVDRAPHFRDTAPA